MDHKCRYHTFVQTNRKKIFPIIWVAHFWGERLYQSRYQINQVLTRYLEGKGYVNLSLKIKYICGHSVSDSHDITHKSESGPI